MQGGRPSISNFEIRISNLSMDGPFPKSPANEYRCDAPLYSARTGGGPARNGRETGLHPLGVVPLRKPTAVTLKYAATRAFAPSGLSLAGDLRPAPLIPLPFSENRSQTTGSCQGFSGSIGHNLQGGRIDRMLFEFRRQFAIAVGPERGQSAHRRVARGPWVCSSFFGMPCLLPKMGPLLH